MVNRSDIGLIVIKTLYTLGRYLGIQMTPGIRWASVLVISFSCICYQPTLFLFAAIQTHTLMKGR